MARFVCWSPTTTASVWNTIAVLTTRATPPALTASKRNS
jgi:hypothetical protein